MLHKRTPIGQFESQSNNHKVYEDQFLCLAGGDVTANER